MVPFRCEDFTTDLMIPESHIRKNSKNLKRVFKKIIFLSDHYINIHAIYQDSFYQKTLPSPLRNIIDIVTLERNIPVKLKKIFKIRNAFAVTRTIKTNAMIPL